MRSRDSNQRNTSTQGPFGPLALRMENVTYDGGICKEVVQAGEGPAMPRDASILLHYSAFLEYADQPFESTNFKYPRMMKLGRDITLAGLELALLTMKKGEFARFLLQPPYAYGEMGCPPLIPSAATILYEIQVVDYFDSAQADHFVGLEPDQQNTLPLSVLASVANTLRTLANRCFNQGRYDAAKFSYKKVMTVLKNRLQAEEEKEEEEEAAAGEVRDVKALLLPVYLNLCLTELHLESPRKALKYANWALDIDPRNTKALFRCGQAYMDMHEYEEAKNVLILAQAKKPLDCDINRLLLKVAKCYNNGLDQQKEVYSRMFKAWRT